jgi:hypothetical protein
MTKIDDPRHEFDYPDSGPNHLKLLIAVLITTALTGGVIGLIIGRWLSYLIPID